jgi:hypothetical protein
MPRLPHSAFLFALASSLAVPGQAEEPPRFDFRGAWTWEQLAAIPGVDAAQVQALHSAPDHDAREAIRLAAGLDSPESAQIVAALMDLDGYAFYPAQVGPFHEVAMRFAQRPPRGDAGVVRNAALALELRTAIDRFRLPFFPAGFTHASWPATKPLRPVRYEWTFKLDVAPAKLMLDLLDKRTPADGAYAALGGPVFEGMYQHRSQSFYPAAMTRSRLAMTFGFVNAGTPVIDYYRFANPIGLLDLNEVSSHRQEYRAIVGTIAAHSSELTNTVQGMIGPYIPDGTKFDRTVNLLFGDGADGWVSGTGVAGLDLEFFKDDYPRLIDLLAHETYHVAQQAARRPETLASNGSHDAAGIFGHALEDVFREGTATFVASPKKLDAAARAEAVSKGLDTLQRLAAEADPDKAQSLGNDGVRGAGPFYYLGAEMARVIVAKGGGKALAETLRCGGLCYFSAYFDAVRAQPHERMLFTPDFVRRVRALQ